jgi:hypothetical protein
VESIESVKNVEINRNGICLVPIVVLFALVFAAFGCRKSQREVAEEKAIKRHEQELQQQKMNKPPPGLMEGLNFLRDLANKNQLPGLSTNDHVNLTLEMDKADTEPDGRVVRQFHLFTSGSPRTNYFYVLAEDTNNHQLQLVKAWRADEWKVIEEYAVK